ncbi:MAG TPA: hypothetical protein VMI53_05145, partial [Opitutaceae bacterium]|nr:hypothetical protein [Opitutaceae bacterium]
GEFNVGLGEVVDLSYHSVAGPHPSQNPSPEFFGGLNWIATGGSLAQPEKPNGTATWTAPDIGSPVHLKVLTQAQNCTMADITVHVKEPTDVKMEKKGETLKEHPNKVTVGFFAHILILPDDVSFTALQVKEGDAAVKAWGWWKFADGLHHCNGFGEGKYEGHNKCRARPLVVSPALGTKVKGADMITSGTSNWQKEWLQAPLAERQKRENDDLGTYEDPYDGGYTWDIPWLYTLGQAAPKLFKVVRVEAKCDKTGKATLSKDASGAFSKEFSDPATNVVVPAFPPP